MGTITAMIAIILLLIILIIFLIAPGRGCKEARRDFSHLNFAHRGLHSKDKKIPENSLPAFRAAIQEGYGIELDIQLTKDGQIVVFHDHTLNRVCGIDGRVDEYTFEELQKFELCQTKEKIPLFTEVLKTVNGQVPLLVELKNGHKNKYLCQTALNLLRSYDGLFCIESFSPFIVGWFKRHAPDIFRGQLSASTKVFKPQIPRYQSALLAHMITNCIARPHFIAYHKEKNSVFLKICEAMGAMCFVWTVRKNDNIAHYEASNDGVIFEFYRPKTRY